VGGLPRRVTSEMWAFGTIQGGSETEFCADAVLAASVFHFRQLTIGQVKEAMAAEGITVR
jgi:imidazole glycerol phosphate synthase subunit HisF